MSRTSEARASSPRRRRRHRFRRAPKLARLAADEPAMDTRTSPARLRIERLQELLREAGCAALVVPSSDPHISEYLPERWQARRWASGFNGSMGTLVVTTDRAALFADSRYWVQAERELAGSGIELVRIASPAAAMHVDWLCEHVARGGRDRRQRRLARRRQAAARAPRALRRRAAHRPRPRRARLAGAAATTDG